MGIIKKKIIGKIPNTISGLSDTDLHNIQNGQILKYNSDKEKWENSDFTGGGGGNVNSVNGKTGDVILNYLDVGALPEGSIGNGTITIKLGSNVKGSFRTNLSNDTTIVLDSEGSFSIGTLNTNNSDSLSTNSSESFEENINLHKISKTGSYKDLVDLPTGNNSNFLAFSNEGFVDSGYNGESFLSKLIPGSGISINNNIISLSGESGGGDSVTIIPSFSEGTKIADFIINGNSGMLYAPTGGNSTVSSVNGQTGVVTLVASDVGALPSDTPYQIPLTEQTDYQSMGDSTHIPIITTNSLGLVTSIVLTPIDGITKAEGQSLQAQIDELYELLHSLNPTNIYWSPAFSTVYLNIMSGVENVYPTLYGASGLNITYSSSDTSVATINSNGEVTPVAVGRCTITATPDLGNAASYTLIVENDALQEVSWPNGRISKSSLNIGEQATLTKNEVYAVYKSGQVEVTNSTTYTYTGGSISGNTYTAPNVAGTYNIKVKYNNRESTQEITVTVTEPSAPRANVLVGHGPSYESAEFTDTNSPLSNNMIVTVNRNAGDYVFIKVDKNDTVNNLYTYSGPMENFEYRVNLDDYPINVGDYKYYKTTSRFNAGEILYKINKV